MFGGYLHSCLLVTSVSIKGTNTMNMRVELSPETSCSLNKTLQKMNNARHICGTLWKQTVRKYTRDSTETSCDNGGFGGTGV